MADQVAIAAAAIKEGTELSKQALEWLVGQAETWSFMNDKAHRGDFVEVTIPKTQNLVLV